MHKELPLYIFLRNTVILCLIFFTTSIVIIERGKIERGEHSIFKGIIKNKKNIRDYTSPDFTSNNKENTDFQYSNNHKTDSLETLHSSGIMLVEHNKTSNHTDIEIDL